MTLTAPRDGKEGAPGRPQAVPVSLVRPCPVCRGTSACRLAGSLIACERIDNGQGEARCVGNRRFVVYDLTAFRHVPAPEAAVALLRAHFFNRTDRICFFAPWEAPCPAEGEDNLDDLLRSHVSGRDRVSVRWRTKKKPDGGFCWGKGFRIGSYGPALDGTTCWVVLDFDAGGEHSAPLADVTACALACLRTCRDLGIPAYLERSRSGAGWHVWIFFSPAVPAHKARLLAFAVAPQEALLEDGTLADATNGHGIEVFPKRDNMKGAMVGNQVWLPWHCGAKKGGNVFYRQEGGFGLVPYIPERFDAIPEAQVDAALADAGREEGDE